MSSLDTIAIALQTELQGSFDIEQMTRATIRRSVALVLGAAIGWERETRDAAAGLRTHILVTLGAALFVLIPAELGMDEDAVSRELQGNVSGIGFLGAGAVLKRTSEGQIHGLTTAASIWAAAAVGIAEGLGREGTALLATAFIFRVLAWLRRLGGRKVRPSGAKHVVAKDQPETKH